MKRVWFYTKRTLRDLALLLLILVALWVVYELFIAGSGMSPAEIGGSR